MRNSPKLPQQPLSSPPADDELTADEAVQAAIDYELEQRRWLRSLLPLLLDQSPPADSRAVEFARDLARIAAAERACRILRSDQPAAERAAQAAEAERARAAEG
jgi:hypothetical protein